MSQSITWILIFVGLIIAVVIAFLLKPETSGNSERLKGKAQPHIIKQNDVGFIDYDVYIMTQKEKLVYIIIAVIAVFIIGFIFYQNIIVSLLITPVALLYPRFKNKDIIKKRKEELNLQFKEALYSLSSSLSAGKSVEMAFKDALKDLAILYPEPNTFIIKEFEIIIRKLEMNETVEAALEDFACRSHVEDIKNFVDVFKTCKRTGGNLVKVMKNTSDIINDKIVIKQEITTILSQRKFEQKILNFVPIGMIFLLSTSSADFMEPIFTQISGRVVMTIAIVLLVTAYFISKKIMDIEV